MSAEPDAGAQSHVHAGPGAELSSRIAALPSAWAFWPVVVGAATFVVAALILAWANAAKPTLKLEVSFSPDACCSWQVWVNGTTTADITVLPMQWGKTATYSVPLYTTHVDHLRMPMGQSASETVTIRKLWIARGTTIVASADPAQLNITASNARRVAGATFAVTAPGPFLDVPVSLDTHESRARLFIARMLSQPLQAAVGLLLLGALLTIPVALVSRRGALLAISTLLTMAAVRSLSKLSVHLSLHDDVSRAVSQSVYVGAPKRRELFILEAAVALAAVIPVIVVLAARARWRDPVAAVADDRPPRHARRTTAVLVALPTLLVALADAPNLRALIGAGRSVQYVPSWDSNNLIFWQYLVQKTRLVPIKDFFWPYGLQWLFDEGVPWGQVMTYVGYLAFWALLALGTYWSLARFFSGAGLVIRYALVTGFWVSAVVAGYMIFSTRYVAPLAVLLLYSGIDERDDLRSARRFVFACGLFLLLLFEFAQALYALVAIAFLLAFEIVLLVPHRRAAIAAWAARTAATFVVPFAAAAAVLAALGSLGPTFAYYSELGAISAADAYPGSIDVWARHPNSLAGFIFWATPLTIALGAFGLASERGRRRSAAAVVTALGFLAAMVMQKQVLRPPIESQMWLPAVFGLVFWLAVGAPLHARRRWSAVAATAGAIAATILVVGGYHRGWTGVRNGPGSLSHSVGALLHDRNAFAADERAAFTPERFAKFTDYQPVVRALRQDPNLRGNVPFWILGDGSPIVMMLGRSWPYYFNDFYDASPLAFQKKILHQLAQTPPKRVVFDVDPASMTFDYVPNVVRVPLLFQWSVAHLEPLRTAGHFAILRPRRPAEPIALAWWRVRLGDIVNLGHIPAVAHLPGGTCSNVHDCGTYLVVDAPAGVAQPGEIHVNLKVGGLPFVVVIATSNASRYVVPLDRLWFWHAAAESARSVTSQDAPGLRITVVKRRVDPNRLY